MPAPTTANATRAEETATIAEKKRIKFNSKNCLKLQVGSILGTQNREIHVDGVKLD